MEKSHYCAIGDIALIQGASSRRVRILGIVHTERYVTYNVQDVETGETYTLDEYRFAQNQQRKLVKIGQ